MKISRLTSIKSWLLGGLAGLFAGFGVASVMTFLDWRQNPAGMFQGQEGTNWGIVFETAFSWFWPFALIVFIPAAIAHSWLKRKKSS